LRIKESLDTFATRFWTTNPPFTDKMPGWLPW
jgi:hypothetical protein